MPKYRELVYKVNFWVFTQVACFIAFILSGDILKTWKGGVEFSISIQEIKQN